MPISSNRSDIIPALTGLRFFAALMVFFSHYNIPGLHGWALRVQGSGYSGVTFFFVLSGFIIAYNYLDKFEAAPAKNTIPYSRGLQASSSPSMKSLKTSLLRQLSVAANPSRCPMSPRFEIIHELPEYELACGCGCRKHATGEGVSEQLNCAGADPYEVS